MRVQNVAVVAVIEYVLKRTGRVHKKKEGFLKSKSAEVVVADKLRRTHTLSGHIVELKEMMQERYGRLPGSPEEEKEIGKAVSKAITHTHDHFSFRKKYGHIHQSKADAQRWHILFQLLTVLPAVKYKRTDLYDVGERTERIIKALEDEYGKPVFYYRMDDDIKRREYIILPPYDPREGKLIPPFSKLKEDPEFRKRFIDLFLEAHEMPKSRYGEQMKKYLKLAMDAAEEVAEFLGEEGKDLIKPEDLARLKKLTGYLDTLMREEFYLRPVEKKEKQKPPEPERGLAVENDEIDLAGENGKGTPPDSRVKLEVLSILNGLEFAGFSEEAKQKAIERLSSRIEELSAGKPTPENLQRLGLHAFAIEIIKRGEVERAGEIEDI